MAEKDIVLKFSAKGVETVRPAVKIVQDSMVQTGAAAKEASKSVDGISVSAKTLEKIIKEIRAVSESNVNIVSELVKKNEQAASAARKKADEEAKVAENIRLANEEKSKTLTLEERLEARKVKLAEYTQKGVFSGGAGGAGRVDGYGFGGLENTLKGMRPNVVAAGMAFRSLSEQIEGMPKAITNSVKNISSWTQSIGAALGPKGAIIGAVAGAAIEIGSNTGRFLVDEWARSKYGNEAVRPHQSEEETAALRARDKELRALKFSLDEEDSRIAELSTSAELSSELTRLRAAVKQREKQMQAGIIENDSEYDMRQNYDLENIKSIQKRLPQLREIERERQEPDTATRNKRIEEIDAASAARQKEQELQEKIATAESPAQRKKILEQELATQVAEAKYFRDYLSDTNSDNSQTTQYEKLVATIDQLKTDLRAANRDVAAENKRLADEIAAQAQRGSEWQAEQENDIFGSSSRIAAQSQGDALARIGGIIGGSSSPQLQAAQETAKNTARLVELVRSQKPQFTGVYYQ